MMTATHLTPDLSRSPFVGFQTSLKTSPANRGYITDYRPQNKTRVLLEQIQAILAEYRDHWPLTVRQIFYRLVGAYDYQKDEAAYKRLTYHMSEARRARVIPFNAIRDDGVSQYGSTQFRDADHFIQHVQAQGRNYRRDKLANQPVYIEVWCEAAGMVPQLARVANAYSIRSFSSSGFDSLTAKYDMAQRICEQGKPAVIIHLGDFDPSGVCIFDTVAADVSAFVEADRLYASINVRFERIALTADQVQTYRLPTAPAKETDRRSSRWTGETCQLEALTPDAIAQLLRDAILLEIDQEQLEADCESEHHERERIGRLLLTAGGGQ